MQEPTNNRQRLIDMQREAYARCDWGHDGVLPYSKRRDNTFGQYVANCQLMSLEPFARTLENSTAVTICDGRGVEASFLTQMGLTTTATDLCAINLQSLSGNSTFHNWSEENAESLSFPDEYFDWGMVKAGLHHLPRPLVGLYELLRVSREGIIVMEGHDGGGLRAIRKLFAQYRDWEESGNYVYRFRHREIEKICLGLNLPGFATQTRLTPYRAKYELITKGTIGYTARVALNRLGNKVLQQQGNLFATVIFKSEPSDEQIELLASGGFSYRQLPRNPYATPDQDINAEDSMRPAA